MEQADFRNGIVGRLLESGACLGQQVERRLHRSRAVAVPAMAVTTLINHHKKMAERGAGAGMAGTLGGGGRHKEPDETVLTKVVVGTVIVAVQSLDTQLAGFIELPVAFW